MRVLLGLPLLILAFAGCLGADDVNPGPVPASVDAHGFALPVPLCHAPNDEDPVLVDGTPLAPKDARCDFEMTPDEGREGNEVTIAVNPMDPRNIVGGAKDYYAPDAGECVWDGVYVTHDGGRTYEDRSFDGSPWRARDGDPSDFNPNYASQFWCTTDPVAYFDVNGNLYYLLMAYQADPASGSKTCQAECPQGALNDWAFNRAVQIVAVSDDGGDTFHTFTPVLEGSFPVNFHDKGWLAASADGTVHVMWLAFFVPGNQYCRSTDGGQTYLCTEIAAVQFLDAGQGSFIDVGTGPEVYLSWYNGGIVLKRSDDTGATWGEARMVQGTNPQSMAGLSERDRRTGYPTMATDRNPDSPFADGVYLTWNDACNEDVWSDGCANGGNEIWFSASQDKGETFGTPVRLSAGDPGAWNIFPAVSVSPGGVIDVSWMSTEDSRSIPCPEEAGIGEAECEGSYATFEQHYAYSLDGGATWSAPMSIRHADDAGWDPALCHHQNGMIFIGDYNDIDSSWQAAHPVWPDSRHGHCDVYTATLERPAFAEGWSEAGMAVAQAWMADNPL